MQTTWRCCASTTGHMSCTTSTGTCGPSCREWRRWTRTSEPPQHGTISPGACPQALAQKDGGGGGVGWESLADGGSLNWSDSLSDTLFLCGWMQRRAALLKVVSVLLNKLQKVQTAAEIWPHPSDSWNSALATSNTSHSIQNFNYLLHCHLWNSHSVSVQSPSTLHSSKTKSAIHISHTNLCHPACKHKKHLVKDRFLTLAHLFGTTWLKHSATPILPPLVKLPSRRTCSVTVFHSRVYPPVWCVCVCVCC